MRVVWKKLPLSVRARAVRRYLNAEPIEDIAREAGISPFTLKKALQRETGLSPIEVKVKRKLEIAQALDLGLIDMVTAMEMMGVKAQRVKEWLAIYRMRRKEFLELKDPS